jgi:hypothetical protein
MSSSFNPRTMVSTSGSSGIFSFQPSAVSSQPIAES